MSGYMMNDSFDPLGETEGSIEKAEESLRLAEVSKDKVRILRSRLALGISLLNIGNLRGAESHFGDIIIQTQDETDDSEIIQVFGWALIMRVNILLGKSLYNQAEVLALDALGVLSGIKDYTGLKTVNSLLARIYQNMNDAEKAEFYQSQSEEYARLTKE